MVQDIYFVVEWPLNSSDLKDKKKISNIFLHKETKYRNYRKEGKKLRG